MKGMKIMEEKKNKNMVVIIIILCLLLVGAVGFIVYDKSFRTSGNNNNINNNNDSDKEIDNKVESLNISSDFVKGLYNKTKYYEHISSRNEYFSKDKLLVSSMSNDLKARIAIANMSESSILYGEDKFIEEVPVGEYFSEKDLIEGFNKAFGKNAVYNRIDKIAYSENELGYDYYDEEGIYYAIPGGSGYAVEFSYDEDIISAYKYSDKIEITTALAYCGTVEGTNKKGCYADSKGKELIDSTVSETEKFSGVKYKDKLGQYKYTFTLDNSDGNYYFYSVEKIK